MRMCLTSLYESNYPSLCTSHGIAFLFFTIDQAQVVPDQHVPGHLEVFVLNAGFLYPVLWKGRKTAFDLIGNKI